jgi:ring-1,2-phenylacetyl-CoA epoxidase subunit PaaE
MSAANPKFHRLSVRDVKRQTADALSLSFFVPPELCEDYAFVPGQYLTLRAEFDGEEVRRSYSICSGPDDGELRIAVKQVDNGLFSGWMNSAVKAGDVLDVMTPTGRFGAGPLKDGRIHVAFAAGSGVTPILSIMRAVLAHEPNSRFFLFYGNRATRDILFREELEALKDRYLGRLAVLHILSREEQDLPMLNGRLEAAKIPALLRAAAPPGRIDNVFLCGPAGMTEALEPALKSAGVAAEKIHIERFVSALGGRPRP